MRVAPRRGQVWTAFSPGHPDDIHQPRPVLIVSHDVRNRLADDVIVVPIFSVGRLGPTRVSINAGTGGIPHDSVLFCAEITTITHEFLDQGPLGTRVPEALLQEVIRAVRRALGDFDLPE